MIRIAKLNQSHNQEMLRIMYSSPMKTPLIEVLFDKGPNISLLNEVWAKKYCYYGIFDDTLLLGFGSCLEYDGYFDTSLYSFSYLGNFCIHPDYRKQGLFKKLTEFILQEVYKKENICFCMVLQGNTSMESFFKNKDFQFRGVRNFKVFDTYVTTSVLITKKRKESTIYSIQQASEHHKRQLIDVLASVFIKKNFAPVINLKTFDKKINGTYNIALKDYRLAFKNDEIVGICGVWKMHPIKRTKIIRLKSWFRFIFLCYTLFAKILKYPCLPMSGDTLKEVYLTDLYVKDNKPAILQAMLFSINNELRTHNYNLIHFATSKENPMLRATKPFFSIPIYSKIYSISKNHKFLNSIDKIEKTEFPYIDVALV